DYMRAQPFVRREGALVIGNSAGAWGALALAARNPTGVSAVINFAGGRGGHNRNRPGNHCAPDRLVAAAAELGGAARLPTLWLYADTDTYFPPDLSRRMADAFTAAGGPTTYQLLPLPGQEGHNLIDHPAIWTAEFDAFLRR